MGHTDNDQPGVHPHISTMKVNVTVYLSLLLLTGITIATSRMDLGIFNIAIAMFIASVKATIVFLWFMHLKYDNWVNRIIFATGFFFTGIFFLLTASDIFNR